MKNFGFVLLACLSCAFIGFLIGSTRPQTSPAPIDVTALIQTKATQQLAVQRRRGDQNELPIMTTEMKQLADPYILPTLLRNPVTLILRTENGTLTNLNNEGVWKNEERNSLHKLCSLTTFGPDGTPMRRLEMHPDGTILRDILFTPEGEKIIKTLDPKAVWHVQVVQRSGLAESEFQVSALGESVY